MYDRKSSVTKFHENFLVLNFWVEIEQISQIKSIDELGN